MTSDLSTEDRYEERGTGSASVCDVPMAANIANTLAKNDFEDFISYSFPDHGFGALSPIHNDDFSAPAKTQYEADKQQDRSDD